MWTAEASTGTDWSRKFGVAGSGVDYNGMDEFICTGPFSCGDFANQTYTQNYSLSVRGGQGDINYFVSGGFGDTHFPFLP